MKILQGGAPKCGNFWLYRILEEILSEIGEKQPKFIEQHPIFELAKNWELNYPGQAAIDMIDITDLQTSYRISSIFKMPILQPEEYFGKTNHVWTHSPICKKSGEIFKFFDKKVYIIRDPRDRAVSAANYYCSDYMLKYFPQEEKNPKEFLEKNFEALMTEWTWHVFDHLRYSQKYDIHICFFEGFLNDFKNEISNLLEYLQLELTEKEIQKVEKAVSFSTLKKDNPKHLKKGKSGYWKDFFTAEQAEKAEIIAGPLMRFLNYSENESRKPHFSINSTENDFEALKQEIISSQKELF